MITQLHSFQTIGLDSKKITVEVGMRRGEAKTHIVGLADMAVQESKQRVWMALQSTKMQLATGRITTINLAPASVKKSGPRFDLAIALGILISHGKVQPKRNLNECAFLGELALDGSLRRVSGVLSAAIACKEEGITTLFVPTSNAAEAANIEGINVVAVSHLQDVIQSVCNTEVIVSAPVTTAPSTKKHGVDFADVRGQVLAKRALEIAAAGGHNVLLTGAPGSGKTLLAKALPSILPPLNRSESIEVTQIYSVANKLDEETSLLQTRPFRTIHHTASGVSIVGGGREPSPGEITLAHKGVLFLDELAEFPTHTLEVLRQPLEDKTITITRTNGSVRFPADFMLIAAMNPPEFSAKSRLHTQKKLSAPLLDRIDLTVHIEPVPLEELELQLETSAESSESILTRVHLARTAQTERLKNDGIHTNAEMNTAQLQRHCRLEPSCTALLKAAAEKLQLSARGYHRTIKVARTIADLDQSESIQATHIAEALQFRQPIFS